MRVDAFIDASGAPAAVTAGIHAVRPAGRVVLVGSGAETMPLPTQLIQNRELTLTGVFRYANTWPAAIALVDHGRVDLDAMVTGRYPLEKAADALDADRNPGSVKAVVAGLMKLDTSALARLPIAGPSYDRGDIAIGIVHFGVGGFHRAHQAMYIDQLLEQGLAREWGICGVGVMPADLRMKNALSAQDGLYTLILQNSDGSRDVRVIGSILDYRYAPDDPEAVIELLAAPTTRIVSMTITEGGYNIDNADEDSVFGLVTEALARRRARDITPPTIVSCDNIEGNGDVAREAFTGYAARVDPDLSDWMTEHVRFPNSMVDRITPVTTGDVVTALAEEFDVEDQWPVVTEPFTAWVLEDDFTDGRPPLEEVGVLMVDDVTPYELMKLRLLNASHQGLCYFAYLAGTASCTTPPVIRCSPTSWRPTWIPRPPRL